MELFHRYREPIFGFFCRRLDDRGRSEDLEAFVALLKGVGRYEPRALFRTYLYGVAFHLLAAEHRRRAKQQASSAEKATELESATGADPDEAIWVRQAVAHLEEDARQILMLREYEQLSYAEIAALLRLPVNTVRSRLFRARMALKELLIPR